MVALFVMISLRELAKIHGIDKGAHGYCEFYEKRFSSIKTQVQKVLEIGIDQGGSLRMWRDFFPNATIFGIDNRSEFIFSENRILTFLIDQTDRIQLEIFGKNYGLFDIIIDDGSHQIEHQQISFGCLFKYLKIGGFYIIEDLEPSFDSGYGSETAQTKFSTYEILKNFSENGITKSKHIKAWKG